MNTGTTLYGAPMAGATAGRPVGSPPGSTYFDTTLGKQLVYDGTIWVIVETGLAA